MQALLLLLAVATLSVLASSPRLLEAGRFFQLAQLAASGMLFLALGAALGPHAAGLLRAADLEALRPLTALGLGFAGLLIGLHLDLRLLRRLPREVFVAAFSQSFTAFTIVAVPIAAVLWWTTSLTTLGALGAAALLGAAASVSSAHLAVLWFRTGRMERRRGLSVALLAMLDDLTGLLVLAVAVVLSGGADLLTGAGLVVLPLAMGALCGALVYLLVHRATDTSELMAVLVGGVALVAGAAAYLRVSALLCGLACGALLALLGGRSVELIYRALSRVERPAYLSLVFLIGAHLDASNVMAWGVLPLFVALRFFGKLLGGSLAVKAAKATLTLPPRLGYALLAQGGVSLCIVTDYLLLAPGKGAELVFSVGVMAALVNEALASRAFASSLEEKTPAVPGGGALAGPPDQAPV